MSDRDDVPFRESLAALRTSVQTISPKVRAKAFRERAGIIGALGSCICAWPVVKADTDTEHPEWCVAHRIIHSQRKTET